MRKFLLLVPVLLGLVLPRAHAQAPTDESLASQQFKQHLRQQYLQSDTAQAIINLYGRRQAGGVGWLVAGVLSAVRLSIGGSTTQASAGGYGPQQDNSVNVGVALLAALPVIGYGTAKLLHYSNAHLNAVLTSYAAGQPLPHALRRKLKHRFFAQPIVPYKEVKYKPAN